MEKRKQAGLTLLEMMVVVAIIGLLVAFVAPQVFSGKDGAAYKLAEAQIRTLEHSVERFNLDNGRYPTNAEGLAALVPPPPANLPHYDPRGYEKFVPHDPWDHPYVYSSDGRDFRIVSFGRDGVPGGDAYDADLDSATIGRPKA